MRAKVGDQPERVEEKMSTASRTTVTDRPHNALTLVLGHVRIRPFPSQQSSQQKSREVCLADQSQKQLELFSCAEHPWS